MTEPNIEMCLSKIKMLRANLISIYLIRHQSCSKIAHHEPIGTHVDFLFVFTNRCWESKLIQCYLNLLAFRRSVCIGGLLMAFVVNKFTYTIYRWIPMIECIYFNLEYICIELSNNIKYVSVGILRYIFSWPKINNCY